MVAKISGPQVWNAFKNEIGKHCCQRVPVTETKGRKQTSLISVNVLPLQDDVSEPLKESELEVIAQTGKQGAGGQHVNKTASAIRMKHIPTGLSVFINGRKQHQNRKLALQILTNRVNELRCSQNDAQYNELRRSQMGNLGQMGKRGDKVRTYNFMESRIVDHTLNRKTHNVKKFMKGDFSDILDG